MILGVTGSARAGKEVFAQRLVEKFGFKNLDFAVNVLDPEVTKRGLEITKNNRTMVATDLRQNQGPAEIPKRMAKLVNPKVDTVITGFRALADIEVVKQHFGSFKLIMVDADPKVRYERGRNTQGNITEEEFFKRDQTDVKTFGMDKVFAIADHTIMNNGTFDEFYEKIDDFMKNVIKFKKSKK